jgi:hypothetical protein
LCIMARNSDFNVPYWLARRHDCGKTTYKRTCSSTSHARSNLNLYHQP